MSTNPAIWVAAIASLAMLSLIYDENPFSSAAEHIFVGLGAGYFAVQGLTNIQRMAWQPLVSGKGIMYLVPIVLGLMVYTRFVKPVAYLARIPATIVISMGAALGLRGSIETDFVRQIAPTMALKLNTFDNWVIVFGTFATLAYFYFTKVENRVVAQVQSVVGAIGRATMMIAFGALFANSMFTFAARFTGRLQFLFGKWIPIMKVPF